ncbi:MAG: 2-phospho-L-lactate guanylyltransferase [Pseudonocardiaceae bacterium]
MLVELLVPVKSLARAKTRLRRAADGGIGSTQAHLMLALALARDTIAAAAGAAMVHRVVAICSDAMVREALVRDGVEVIEDEPAAGLNPALRYGEAVLRATNPAAAIGALQADLPALRPAELDCAVRDGLATGSRAFCTDRAGIGTTLLLAAPQLRLDPQFGPESAAAHRARGARELSGCWPGLRCDVDTVADLAVATDLGVGPFTRSALPDFFLPVIRTSARCTEQWTR